MTIRTETDLQRAILLRIGALPGVYVARTDARECFAIGAGGALRPHVALPTGWPDITGCVWGRMFGVEVKSPTIRRKDKSARLRKSQEKIRKAWEAAGGLWITASALEDVDCLVGMARGGK